MEISSLEMKDKYLYVPAFNIPDITTAFFILKSANKLKMPVYLQVSARVFDVWGRAYIQSLKQLTSCFESPASIYLDHCSNNETCLRAINSGVSGVLFDGGVHKFEDYFSASQIFSKYCKSNDILFEGEITSVPGEEDGFNAEVRALPQIEQVLFFLENSGVDTFAPIFGNRHGAYQSDVAFNLNYLSELRGKTLVPFVIHGGSGMPVDIINDLKEIGFCKFNVSTELKNILTNSEVQKTEDLLKKNQMLDNLIDGLVGKYMDLLEPKRSL